MSLHIFIGSLAQIVAIDSSEERCMDDTDLEYIPFTAIKDVGLLESCFSSIDHFANLDIHCLGAGEVVYLDQNLRALR